MKKTFALFVASLMFAGCNLIDGAKYKRLKLDNSLLWEISGNGLAAPSFLFGTDHLVGGNFLDTLPYVMVKFKQCKAVATEMRPDSLHEYRSHISLVDDSLSNLFTASEFSQIDKTLLHYLPWPLKRYNRLKPVYVYYALSAMISARTASSTNHHLDLYFREEGNKMGYKILGLEPRRFHDSLLYDAPLDVQKKQLLYLINHIDIIRKSQQKSFDLYHHQDLNGLEIQINPKSEFKDYRLDKVLKYRDEMWIKELPAIMKQQPTFIAVGVDHLMFDCGLINQLRLKGYTVKPVLN